MSKIAMSFARMLVVLIVLTMGGSSRLAPAATALRPAFAIFHLQQGYWRPYNGALRSNGRILVLAHGVLETLQSAFPDPVAAQIQLQGGYDEVVGISYDWSIPTQQLVARYARLLRSLPAQHLDLEAHSYGTILTLAAMTSAKIYPKNIILLAAPLEGTPMARTTLLSRVLLELPPKLWNGNIGKFHEMEINGAEADLQPGSPLLRETIPSFLDIMKQHHVHVILAAGSDPLRMGLLANLYLWVFAPTCGHCYQANDGVIPVESALGYSLFAPGAVDMRVFPLAHADLKGDPQVIKFVAEHLDRSI